MCVYLSSSLCVQGGRQGRWQLMAPHSSTFAWKIPWTEEPGRLQSMGSLESDTTERLSCIGEGNGNPLQCSCLENPRDGGAWRAAVYGVAQSRTWLKWLSSSSSSRDHFVLGKKHSLCGKDYKGIHPTIHLYICSSLNPPFHSSFIHFMFNLYKHLWKS